MVKNNSSVLTKSKSRELIVRDGELCDFKDGEANSLRIWLEMKESGENLLGYMVKSGIEGLEKKNGIGEMRFHRVHCDQNFINAYGKNSHGIPVSPLLLCANF